MKKNKKCIAMLLAGGQGSRLFSLTKNIAKPAVHFGSKYRIIDFPLSNCINSGIDTVGVLTQYKPLELNDYVGNGSPWDLDREYGGVHILPPYQGSDGGDWYKGTANAIYQNISFIERYNPRYVLILSGDHIYKMNYSLMLDKHIENNADCTIAVIDVPLKEASRFGIMNTHPDMSIYEFEEKPKVPKSTKASMGIYIFNTEVLLNYLTEDENNKASDHDFGKNIIPKMLSDGKKLFGYQFKGYWKDVGTINSLWEANMDLLGEKPNLNLLDHNWRIYFRHRHGKPHYTAAGSSVKNSLVAEGCELYGKIKNSVLFEGVVVEKGAVVEDSVIMNDTVIKAGAEIKYSIVAENSVVGSNAKIGNSKKTGSITVIASDIEIGDNVVVKAGEMIEQDMEGK